MAVISLKEYAERNGLNPISARLKASKGGFKTAQKVGRDWIIDEDELWEDKRVKSGKYKNWRKKRPHE